MKSYLKLNVVLMAFLLTPLLGICQLCLDSNEVKTAIKVFWERDAFRDRANELLLSLDSCAAAGNSAIEKKDRVIQSQKSLLRLSDEIITTDSLAIAQLNKDIERGWKKEKWLKLERGALFFGVLILAVKILL